MCLLPSSPIDSRLWYQNQEMDIGATPRPHSESTGGACMRVCARVFARLCVYAHVCVSVQVPVTITAKVQNCSVTILSHAALCSHSPCECRTLGLFPEFHFYE